MIYILIVIFITDVFAVYAYHKAVNKHEKHIKELSDKLHNERVLNESRLYNIRRISGFLSNNCTFEVGDNCIYKVGQSVYYINDNDISMGELERIDIYDLSGKCQIKYKVSNSEDYVSKIYNTYTECNEEILRS